VAVVVLILSVLRSKGKLVGAVGPEHFHDLGKLQLSFTIFWAYIAFSQYFLIWYSNIPEETAYMKYRSEHWRTLGIILIIGHFAAPFLILLFREVKRNYRLLSLIAVWAIIIHILDILWAVRPMVYSHLPEAPSGAVVIATDVIGILAVILIFAGYLVRRVPSAALVGVGDPFMSEAIAHKNYV